MLNVENLITSIDYTVRSVENIINKKDFYKEEINLLLNRQKELEEQILFIQGCKKLYINAVDVLYEKSIGTLKTTLDMAIQHIMYDKNYSVNLTLDDSRGNKTLEISVVDNDKGFEVDATDGCGQGVRTIISFVLKMYYLLNEGSKILFLDEKYSALSAQYVPLFFDFVKKMTEEKDFIIVMITHDPRFHVYADKIYNVNDGIIKLVETSEETK